MEQDESMKRENRCFVAAILSVWAVILFYVMKGGMSVSEIPALACFICFPAFFVVCGIRLKYLRRQRGCKSKDASSSSLDS